MQFSTLSTLLATLSLLQPTTAHPHHQKLTWTLIPTNTTQQFRGLSPISSKTIWVSGTNGTVLLTANSGSSWTNISPLFSPRENSTDFEFRDIHAWSSKRAAILSIGNGNLSRIYLTHNAGKSWQQTFINEEETAFYDCMAFERERPRHGVAMSDPVNGKVRLIETWDGGLHWRVVSSAGMPAALEGEFGFAASGTCIEAAAGWWYIATGGVDPGRIFRSASGNVGGKWEVSNSSIAGGAAAGVFSVRFKDARSGVAVGGDFEKPTGNANNAAWSRDGGVTWLKAESFPAGYRSGVSWVPGRRNTAVAVGTTGSDITLDGGRNWVKIDNGTFDAVECVSRDACWASGSRGRVARLNLRGL